MFGNIRKLFQGHSSGLTVELNKKVLGNGEKKLKELEDQGPNKEGNPSSIERAK